MLGKHLALYVSSLFLFHRDTSGQAPAILELDVESKQAMQSDVLALGFRPISASDGGVEIEIPEVYQSLLEILKTKNQDMDFKIVPDKMNNVFGVMTLTQTSDKPEIALARHMLHEHGLAPFLCSGDAGFEKFHAQRTVEHSKNNSFLLFVESQELRVQRLFTLLSGMSLLELQILHSIDHGTAFPFTQVARSLQTRAFLKRHLSDMHEDVNQAQSYIHKHKQDFDAATLSPENLFLFHSSQPLMPALAAPNDKDTRVASCRALSSSDGSCCGLDPKGDKKMKLVLRWKYGGEGQVDMTVNPASRGFHALRSACENMVDKQDIAGEQVQSALVMLAGDWINKQALMRKNRVEYMRWPLSADEQLRLVAGMDQHYRDFLECRVDTNEFLLYSAPPTTPSCQIPASFRRKQRR